MLSVTNPHMGVLSSVCRRVSVAPVLTSMKSATLCMPEVLSLQPAQELTGRAVCFPPGRMLDTRRTRFQTPSHVQKRKR